MVKTVQVEDTTWRELSHLKADMMADSFDTVIAKLIEGSESKIRKG